DLRFDRDRFDRLGREGDCAVTRRATGIYDRNENRLDTLPEGTAVRLQEDNRNYNYIEVGVLGERLDGYVSTRDLELVPCTESQSLFIPDRFCREVTETVILYDGPGPNYRSLERVRRGEEVRLESGTPSFEDADGDEWVQITTGSDRTGWIRRGQGRNSILRDCR
ncbi:MAG: hypothetical protein F6K03_08140, partial [Kamptonema sp. SIO4C4]|nr:hypothetical protein [Kamptonema sp. SIO4C4]